MSKTKKIVCIVLAVVVVIVAALGITIASKCKQNVPADLDLTGEYIVASNPGEVATHTPDAASDLTFKIEKSDDTYKVISNNEKVNGTTFEVPKYASAGLVKIALELGLVDSEETSGVKREGFVTTDEVFYGFAIEETASSKQVVFTWSEDTADGTSEVTTPDQVITFTVYKDI